MVSDDSQGKASDRISTVHQGVNLYFLDGAGDNVVPQSTVTSSVCSFSCGIHWTRDPGRVLMLVDFYPPSRQEQAEKAPQYQAIHFQFPRQVHDAVDDNFFIMFLVV
jgi:hypothetical protein